MLYIFFKIICGMFCGFKEVKIEKCLVSGNDNIDRYQLMFNKKLLELLFW